MTLRIQQFQCLCPVFPVHRYWNVHHLGVHSSSPIVCFSFFFVSALQSIL
jgi:hypothetical protein